MDRSIPAVLNAAMPPAAGVGRVPTATLGTPGSSPYLPLPDRLVFEPLDPAVPFFGLGDRAFPFEGLGDQPFPFKGL